MSYKYEYIGWCRQDNHDKIWGIVRLTPDKYLTVWGRRGAKLQTKIVHGDTWSARQQWQSKVRKGYKEIVASQLDAVYPEFQSDLEKTAFWAMFKV